MEAKEFFAHVDKVIDKEPGTLNGDESMADSGVFDSLAILEIIVLLDELFKIEMSPEDISEAGTLRDLFNKLNG